MAQVDYLRLIAEKLQDTAGKLAPERHLEALRAAVDEYSKARPRHKIQTLAGDGLTVTYALATDFEEGFSRIDSIEYPVDRQDPEYLDDGTYGYYRDPTTSVLKLRFYSSVLTNATTAYVDYTVRHHVRATPPAGETIDDTVPITDRDAVASLATAACAAMLAAYYAQSSDPTIGADVVDYRTKAQDYLALARELRGSYNRRFGITDGVLPASGTRDLDVDLSVGWDRFFHSRYRR